MNHAPKTLATLTPYKPVLLNGIWRVGFTAARDIVAGEELTWNYPPRGIDWLQQHPKSECVYFVSVKFGQEQQ